MARDRKHKPDTPPPARASVGPESKGSRRSPLTGKPFRAQSRAIRPGGGDDDDTVPVWVPGTANLTQGDLTDGQVRALSRRFMTLVGAKATRADIIPCDAVPPISVGHGDATDRVLVTEIARAGDQVTMKASLSSPSSPLPAATWYVQTPHHDSQAYDALVDKAANATDIDRAIDRSAPSGRSATPRREEDHVK